MAMSRKHYEAIAASLKDCLDFDSANRNAVAYMAGRFLVDFTDDNPRFDGDRFIIATGLVG